MRCIYDVFYYPDLDPYRNQLPWTMTLCDSFSIEHGILGCNYLQNTEIYIFQICTNKLERYDSNSTSLEHQINKEQLE